MVALKETWQADSLASGEKNVSVIVAARVIASGTVISPETLLKKP